MITFDTSTFINLNAILFCRMFIFVLMFSYTDTGNVLSLKWASMYKYISTLNSLVKPMIHLALQIHI